LADLSVPTLILSVLVLLCSLSVHEAAHAWAADRLGDPTARHLGRLSLNPVVHVDPIGTLLLPLVAILTGAPLIGWAKPVPVNTARLRRGASDFVLVAAAGPASNIAIALAASLPFRVLAGAWADVPTAGAEPFIRMMTVIFHVNLLLAVFNLIPVPPLDGGNILGGLLRGRLARGFDRLRPFGVLVLYALLLSGALGAIIRPPYIFLARLLTL
jgi:Zn-dependent protease